MSLINCPECNHEISNKSKICIHCGFPLDELQKEIIQEIQIEIPDSEFVCVVNGKRCNLENIANKLINKKCTYLEKAMIAGEIREITTLSNGIHLCEEIIKLQKVPKVFNGETNEEFKIRIHQEASNKPKCPTCGSTNISKIGSGERIASVIGLGLMSKKINKSFKCNNCKYSW